MRREDGELGLRWISLLARRSGFAGNVGGPGSNFEISVASPRARGATPLGPGPRVTVLGRAEKTSDEHAKARFIARHPSAAMYAQFGDFAFYRVEPERAHIVAGFGKIDWVVKEKLLTDVSGAAQLAEAEADMVAHMNEDHSDAVGLYANVLCGRSGVGWRLTGVDPEGADLARPGDHCRIAFDKPAATAEEGRVELVRLVKRARQQAAAG